MRLKAMVVFAGMSLTTSALAQQVPGLASCVAADVQLGAHVYRLLDRDGQEIGRVTQEWSWSDEGLVAALRLHSIATGADASFRIESTFEFSKGELLPLYASVRTDTAEPSTEMRRVGDRLVGYGTGQGGERVPVDMEVHEAVIPPGGAAAVVPLLDWDRCEVVTAAVLVAPDTVGSVTFRRSEAELPMAGRMVPAWAVKVEEPGGTAVVFVPRAAPRIELHRESGSARLVWLQ